ncbi:MAG: hypothetical protein ACE37F_17470 [Nannocystaceae bacterium]|nr:hypothetical protein [bacterium]
MRGSALAALVFGLLACSNPQPLPQGKAEFAGTWEGDGVRIEITPEGRVTYDRKKGAGNERIQGPIAGWGEDNFVVGVMTQKTTIEVDEPPHETSGTWTMVINGDTVYRLQP